MQTSSDLALIAAVIAAVSVAAWVKLTIDVALAKSGLRMRADNPGTPTYDQLATRSERLAHIEKWSWKQSATARETWNALIARALLLAMGLSTVGWIMASIGATTSAGLALIALVVPAWMGLWAYNQRARVLAELENERRRLITSLDFPG